MPAVITTPVAVRNGILGCLVRSYSGDMGRVIQLMASGGSD